MYECMLATECVSYLFHTIIISAQFPIIIIIEVNILDIQNVKKLVLVTLMSLFSVQSHCRCVVLGHGTMTKVSGLDFVTRLKWTPFIKSDVWSGVDPKMGTRKRLD